MELPRRILVTGGAGLVGSHLCRRLLREGARVVSMDMRPFPESMLPAEAPLRERFQEWRHDVTRPFTLPVDAVFHLATYPALRYDLRHAADRIRIGVEGTLRVVEAACTAGARVIFASSGEVYGWALRGLLSEKTPFTGGGTRFSTVADTKRAAEAILRACRLQYGLDTRVARLFNTYGPTREEDERVIARMMRSALRGEELVVYGSGEQSRCFCWVEDTVDALVRMAALPRSTAMPVVNVGSPHEIAIRALAEKIIALVGSRSRIRSLEARPEEPRQMTPDIARAREVLGWEPLVPLDEGLRRMATVTARTACTARTWVEVH